MGDRSEIESHELTRTVLDRVPEQRRVLPAGVLAGSNGRGPGILAGVLTGMTMTAIKVPKAARDRLHRLAAADGVTLAQETGKLVRERAPRPRPATGGFRSSRPLTAEEIGGRLAAGFGE